MLLKYIVYADSERTLLYEVADATSHPMRGDKVKAMSVVYDVISVEHNMHSQTKEIILHKLCFE